MGDNTQYNDTFSEVTSTFLYNFQLVMYTYVQAVTQISIQTEAKQAAKQSLSILLLTFCPLELQKLLHKAAIICEKVFSRWRRKFNFNALLGRPVKTTKPLLNHRCAHNYYKDDQL